MMITTGTNMSSHSRMGGFPIGAPQIGKISIDDQIESPARMGPGAGLPPLLAGDCGGGKNGSLHKPDCASCLRVIPIQHGIEKVISSYFFE